MDKKRILEEIDELWQSPNTANRGVAIMLLKSQLKYKKRDIGLFLFRDFKFKGYNITTGWGLVRLDYGQRIGNVKIEYSVSERYNHDGARKIYVVRDVHVLKTHTFTHRKTTTTTTRWEQTPYYNDSPYIAHDSDAQHVAQWIANDFADFYQKHYVAKHGRFRFDK